MSSARSRLVATGVHSVHVMGQRCGRTYAARIVADEVDSVSCRTPAGIHRALVGGRTQAVSSVLTISTPDGAQATWWSACVCQSKTEPGPMGKLITTSACDSCGLSGEVCPSCDIEWQVTAFSRGMVFHTLDSVNQNHAIC